MTATLDDFENQYGKIPKPKDSSEESHSNPAFTDEQLWAEKNKKIEINQVMIIVPESV